MKISTIAQVTALLLACAGVIWGLFAAYAVAFPGPSGEWAILAVYASYVVNVPLGLIAFAIGIAVRQGSARLRRLSIITSLVALSLPILASIISWMHR
jgi:hypothetical protein